MKGDELIQQRLTHQQRETRTAIEERSHLERIHTDHVTFTEHTEKGRIKQQKLSVVARQGWMWGRSQKGQEQTYC